MLAATFNPGAEADELLGILAWCASAAAVGGVIVTGMLMALQLRHGIPGERAEHMRSLFIVLISCILTGSAGPLVAALGPLGL
ncbi:hypothetical protein ACH4C6_33740 [Streptomyces sp. NPDC017943]|uniref:hypothetical protein n=1 Tax=Streptomyces TaxID=1883 RepID=UPI0034550614